MTGAVVVLALIAVTIPKCGVCYNVILPYYTDKVQQTNFIEYVLYSDKIQWGAARTVCQNNGGELAKIDSKKLMDAIVSLATENYQRDIFKADYWVGLVEFQTGEHYWVSDCTNLTYTINYPSDTNHQCYRHKKDTHAGESRSCTENNAFMCEILSPDLCMYSELIVSDVISVDSNMTVCKSLCNQDPKCWATVEYVPDSCVMLALEGYGVQNFTISYKSCFNITENATVITNPDNVNNLPVPNATCGYTLPTSTFVTVASSVGLPMCDPVNVTQTLMLTTTENITFTLTNTSYITQTENITLTKTITMMSTLVQNISNEEAHEVAAEIAKNLTIDSKTTSSHIRRHTSAIDSRKSAVFVGYVGVLFVVVPLGVLFLADIKKLVQDFISHDHLYKDKRKKK